MTRTNKDHERGEKRGVLSTGRAAALREDAADADDAAPDDAAED